MTTTILCLQSMGAIVQVLWTYAQSSALILVNWQVCKVILIFNNKKKFLFGLCI